MFRMSEVVKNLLIINIITFFAVKYLLPFPGIDRFFVLVSPGQDYFDGTTHYTFEPVQLVTHMFMHGNLEHLFFNMFALFMLGPLVEMGLGSKRFLILYLACGLIASIAQLLMVQGMSVGASGAVYGVLAAFATMYPNIELMLLFPPIPIKAKYMAMGLIAIGLFSGFTGMEAGIGHFAHVGGAIAGFLMIRFWKMENLR